MKKKVFSVVLILILSIAISGGGCGTTQIDQLEMGASREINDATGLLQEDLIFSSTRVSDNEMNDSHSIMAQMILLNAGYDSELSSYDAVWLSEVTNRDTGKTATIVITEVDGKTTNVFPSTLQEQLE